MSARSALAVAYLIVFGSLIAYAAYVWLLHNTTPARVSSYAFVNPLVALLLGVWLGDESFGRPRSSPPGLVVGSVVLITRERRRRPPSPARPRHRSRRPDAPDARSRPISAPSG